MLQGTGLIGELNFSVFEMPETENKNQFVS